MYLQVNRLLICQVVEGFLYRCKGAVSDTQLSALFSQLHVQEKKAILLNPSAALPQVGSACAYKTFTSILYNLKESYTEVKRIN